MAAESAAEILGEPPAKKLREDDEEGEKEQQEKAPEKDVSQEVNGEKHEEGLQSDNGSSIIPSEPVENAENSSSTPISAPTIPATTSTTPTATPAASDTTDGPGDTDSATTCIAAGEDSQDAPTSEKAAAPGEKETESGPSVEMEESGDGEGGGAGGGGGGVTIGGGEGDLSSMMEWKDGIASLPGSSMKFRMNEFGVLELIMEDLDLGLSGPGGDADLSLDQQAGSQLDQVPTSEGAVEPGISKPVVLAEDQTIDQTLDSTSAAQSESSSLPASRTTTPSPSSGPGTGSGTSPGYSGRGRPRKNSNPTVKEGTCMCEQCGKRGQSADFCKSGRFCSQSCVGAYASKQGALKKNSVKEALSTTVTNGGPKKKGPKKKMTLVSSGKISPSARLHGDLKMTINMKSPDRPSGKGKKKGFQWDVYLEEEKAIPAPVKFFKTPFPTNKNLFKVGMKLEGIDPRHPSLFCVLTVTEIRGYRLRLHFDGYSECYDFWVNADSPDILPAGWCEKTGHRLLPPKGFQTDFSWTAYLKMTRSTAAPKHLFSNYENESVTPQGFRKGMKLEAVDRKNPSLICVATVTDIMDNRFLIHFDAWEDMYDYWCDATSPYIHPVGWCEENGLALTGPNDYPDLENFTWADYLAKTKSVAVPTRAFKPRPPIDFTHDMRLECVDRRNPSLIRAALILDVEEYRMLIHFDGWEHIYDFWVDDDSMDIHPVGWCAKTGHPLVAPIDPLNPDTSGQSGCPTPGCNGVGHIKGAKYTGHHSAFGCPYSQMNMTKENALPDRLALERGERGSSGANKSPSSPIQAELKCPTPGCEGLGHVTGKYTSHHKLSGCPLAEKNQNKIGLQESTGLHKTHHRGRPPMTGKGNGVGRGKKKHKVMAVPGKQKHENQEGQPTLQTQLHQSVFMSAMSPHPAKDLPLCWEQHSKLLPGVANLSASTVARWTMDEVANFVRKLPGCQTHASKFADEQIDGEAFLLLTQSDIVKIMSIKLGPALKIYNAILILKNSEES